MGLQWQWQANPKEGWAFTTGNGSLRMFSVYKSDSIKTAWDLPDILGQKFPAEAFVATTKFSFKPKSDGERLGLIVHGTDYAYISLVKKADGDYISFSICKQADKGNKETVQDGEKINNADIYFRVKVTKDAVCEFGYSEDGKTYKSLGGKLTARPGRWVGAKVGLFCTGVTKTNDSGYADIDWFRIEPLQ